jgi:hypothetical protein
VKEMEDFNFDVLLTEHLSIILAIDQLNAQFLCSADRTSRYNLGK